MNDRLTRFNVKILGIRILTGILFAFILMHFFFPAAGLATVLVTAGLLVFFAYLFESIRKGGRP